MRITTFSRTVSHYSNFVDDSIADVLVDDGAAAAAAEMEEDLFSDAPEDQPEVSLVTDAAQPTASSSNTVGPPKTTATSPIATRSAAEINARQFTLTLPARQGSRARAQLEELLALPKQQFKLNPDGSVSVSGQHIANSNIKEILRRLIAGPQQDPKTTRGFYETDRLLNTSPSAQSFEKVPRLPLGRIGSTR